MLENIIRHFENQTQYDNDLTVTEARQDTYATDMKDSTNAGADLQIDRAMDNKIKGELTNSYKKGRQQNRHKADEHCNTNTVLIATFLRKKAKKT